MSKAIRPKSIEYLRRYTDLTALLYLLRRKSLTLLDPTLWDDRNDSHFIELYREKRALKSVLALCLTTKGEKYHHWRVFSSGCGGVCIKFNKAVLLEHLAKLKDLHFGPVRYTVINKLRLQSVVLAELPFIKRYGYKDDGEFRIIFEGRELVNTKDFLIPLSCIEQVSLSPWTPKPLGTAIIETLKDIPGCDELKIVHSSLTNNREWRNLGGNVKE